MAAWAAKKADAVKARIGCGGTMPSSGRWRPATWTRPDGAWPVVADAGRAPCLDHGTLNVLASLAPVHPVCPVTVITVVQVVLLSDH